MYCHMGFQIAVTVSWLILALSVALLLTVNL